MNIERITTLLASGLKPSNVASIIGCSPARISQLATQEDFKLLLASKQALAESEDIEEQALSTKYHAAEHALLNQILELAPLAEMRDATAALRVIADRQDKAKTRLNPIQGAQAVIQQVIQITIPQHALPDVVLTSDKEVLAIDNTNLAPLSSTGVTALFASMKGKQNEPARISQEATGDVEEALSHPFEEVLALEDRDTF